MTEVLALPEQNHTTSHEVMPAGTELRALYDGVFSKMSPPDAYKLVDEPGFSDKVLHRGDLQSPYSDERLRKEFTTHAAREAYNESWWIGVQESLKLYAQNPQEAKNLRLNASHTLDVTYDGQPTGQKYEVFEVGGSQDEQTIQTVFDTLQLIDQAAGGALATEGNRPRIVLSDIHLKHDLGGSEEPMGHASDQAIIINTAGLRAIAEQQQMDMQELIAVVVVHELLGHGLERKATGKVGEHFHKHFDYSRKLEKGEIFNEVHAEITPKNAEVGESRPVREYGRVNASEDLATSADSTVAEAMGWTKTTNKHPRFKSQVDPYRREVVMDLMDQAARQAAEWHPSNPGFVGSEVRFVQGPDGQVRTEAARQLNVTTRYGAEAVQAEIDKVVDKQRPKENEIFIVYNDNIM